LNKILKIILYVKILIKMNFSFRKSVKVDFNQAFAQKINPRLKEVSYDTIREIQETFQIFDGL
jgi:hypothetical protein